MIPFQKEYVNQKNQLYNHLDKLILRPERVYFNPIYGSKQKMLQRIKTSRSRSRKKSNQKLWNNELTDRVFQASKFNTLGWNWSRFVPEMKRKTPAKKKKKRSASLWSQKGLFSATLPPFWFQFPLTGNSGLSWNHGNYWHWKSKHLARQGGKELAKIQSTRVKMLTNKFPIGKANHV